MPNTTLTYDIQRINLFDSFEASRRGNDEGFSCCRISKQDWSLKHFFIAFCSFNPSLWPAGVGCRGRVRPVSQLVCQCSPVYLQRPGSPPHPDTLETPLSGQQRQLLHQPLPWVHVHQPSRAGNSAVLQVEDGHCCLRGRHRWVENERTTGEERVLIPVGKTDVKHKNSAESWRWLWNCCRSLNIVESDQYALVDQLNVAWWKEGRMGGERDLQSF